MDPLLSYVIPILALLESQGDPNARCGEATGILQITEICLRDCNRISKENQSKAKYNLRDRLSPLKSREMCELYLSHYVIPRKGDRPEDLVERYARTWYGGPLGESKDSTKLYGEKAVKLFKELERVKKMEEVWYKLNPNADRDGVDNVFNLGVFRSLQEHDLRRANLKRSVLAANA